MFSENIHFIKEEISNDLPICSTDPIPNLIFIVPYRDREQQLIFFKNQMKTVMEGILHKILYIHQNDERSFNRGALKNIGFLIVKQLYPNHYQNITLVFNDIDTMPFSKGFLNYETVPGTVKHFYGFPFTLGGIVSINARDFEKINGFPNFWTWGYEDNMLQTRVLKTGLTIDRSQFYPLYDKNILHFHDGTHRSVNRDEFGRYVKRTNEGWTSITNLSYSIDHESGMVDVSRFDTGVQEDSSKTFSHDLRKSNSPFWAPHNGRGGKMNMII
jgi:N-terminal domain of galactosyltransferase/N-terminal region of glycosyl transferase group 7